MPRIKNYRLITEGFLSRRGTFIESTHFLVNKRQGNIDNMVGIKSKKSNVKDYHEKIAIILIVIVIIIIVIAKEIIMIT